jgi:hypothetical protein
MKKIIFLFCIIFINFSGVNAQEIITQLGSNRQIQGHFRAKNNLKSSLTALKLPFIDDFSNYTLFPDSTKWMDNYVFVNTQFAIFPPTIGVATFDALNDSGLIYSTATASQFPADTLTSRPIRLDSIFQPSLKALKLSDSLYFSFYFQPGGGRGNAWERLGDAPEAEDSLLLEFYSPVTLNWNTVWRTKGMPLDSIYLKSGRYFKYVILPVNDSANYYKNGFQFRFRNYCSLGNGSLASTLSNCDQWNIDYVYLGVNRTKNDSSRLDLTFVEKAPSFLKKYQAMPANQFQASDVRDSLTMLLSNLDVITHTSNYKYEVFDQNNVLLHTENRGLDNISPFWTSGYQTSSVHARPPVSYQFPTAVGQNSWFEIRHIFKEGVSQDLRPENDTNRFIQNFGNYYAYDDGSAENGYGLYPAGSKLAYRFKLNKADTLVAVDMYFNNTYNNANLQYFYLTVWKDNGLGWPGDTIYQGNMIYPVIEKSTNKFHTYFLNRPVKVTGNFFVGWVQSTDDNLNVGFDRNTTSLGNIFFNSSGVWDTSFVSGSLMIRPILGLNYLNVNETSKDNIVFDIFPNPLKDGKLNISIKNNGIQNEKDYKISIINILGSVVYQSAFKPSIEVDALQNGIYFVNISNSKTKQQQVKKLIIAR